MDTIYDRLRNEAQTFLWLLPRSKTVGDNLHAGERHGLHVNIYFNARARLKTQLTVRLISEQQFRLPAYWTTKDCVLLDGENYLEILKIYIAWTMRLRFSSTPQPQPQPQPPIEKERPPIIGSPFARTFSSYRLPSF